MQSDFNMVTFADSLTSDECDELESIVMEKYGMFRDAYWLLKQYIDLIDDLDYIDGEFLKINIIFKDAVDGSIVMDMIEQSLGENDTHVKVREKKNRYVIEVLPE